MKFYPTLNDYITGQQARLAILATANLPEQGVITRVLAAGQTSGNAYSLTQEVDRLSIDCLGILADRHHRSFTLSTGRERELYHKGTSIREHRHIFAVSGYDCRVLSERLGVAITQELLGANIVIERDDGQDYSLTAAPQETYFVIAPPGISQQPKPPIAVLVRHAQQEGCGVTGKLIADTHGKPELTKKFVDESKTHRGIVCRIEYPTPVEEQPAVLQPGQRVFFRYSMGITP